jgi:eukaryotic-like serine/threonine-protein kinase
MDSPPGATPRSARPIPRDVELLRPGASVGRYVVVAKIGAGGMGVVYLAYDPELDRRVALKFLFSSEGRRLRREAQAMAQLSHANIVAVHDVGDLDGRVWLAMEFVEGQTLTRWLAARPRPWRDTLAVLLAAGAGLAAAHRAGLVHRDFKPESGVAV